MKIPDKFEFTANGDRTKYTWENGKYSWYDCGHKYNGRMIRSEVEYEIGVGNWVITKNLDESVQGERELVFPFSYKHKDGLEGAIVEMVNGRIKFSFTDDTVKLDEWEIGDIKDFITGGTWIVTGVGPKAFEASPTNTDKLTIQVDTSEVKEATEALMDLAHAADCVAESMKNLQKVMDKVFKGVDNV